MSKRLIVTSFGSQELNASDNTICCVSVRDSDLLMDSLVQTINATWFDVDASGSNDFTPGPCEVDVLIKESNAADFKTLDDAILALQGTSGTLTGEDVNGTSFTCTARCLSIPVVSQATEFNRFWVQYTLVFQKKTAWS